MSLEGKKLVIEVAEPWDFASSAGENRLEAVVLKSSADDAKPQWLLCSASPFVSGSVTVSQIVIVKRYALEPLLETLRAKKSVGCNCVFVRSSRAANTTDVTALLNDKASGFVAGNAKLVD